MDDRYADHLLGTGRLPADVDTDGSAGCPGYGPHIRRHHWMDSTDMALYDGHVVHVCRKCYLPYPLRHLQPSHPQRAAALPQLESQKLAHETLLQRTATRL